ncbi:MAG: hypothetical protein HY686_01365, partial [Chloroflexi bacterium]|nr:hypothetical protein [Chloroflexota bacterium]
MATQDSLNPTGQAVGDRERPAVTARGFVALFLFVTSLTLIPVRDAVAHQLIPREFATQAVAASVSGVLLWVGVALSAVTGFAARRALLWLVLPFAPEPVRYLAVLIARSLGETMKRITLIAGRLVGVLITLGRRGLAALRRLVVPLAGMVGRVALVVVSFPFVLVAGVAALTWRVLYPPGRVVVSGLSHVILALMNLLGHFVARVLSALATLVTDVMKAIGLVLAYLARGLAFVGRMALSVLMPPATWLRRAVAWGVRMVAAVARAAWLGLGAVLSALRAMLLLALRGIARAMGVLYRSALRVLGVLGRMLASVARFLVAAVVLVTKAAWAILVHGGHGLAVVGRVVLAVLMPPATWLLWVAGRGVSMVAAMARAAWLGLGAVLSALRAMLLLALRGIARVVGVLYRSALRVLGVLGRMLASVARSLVAAVVLVAKAAWAILVHLGRGLAVAGRTLLAVLSLPATWLRRAVAWGVRMVAAVARATGLGVRAVLSALLQFALLAVAPLGSLWAGTLAAMRVGWKLAV